MNYQRRFGGLLATTWYSVAIGAVVSAVVGGAYNILIGLAAGAVSMVVAAAIFEGLDRRKAKRS